MSTFLIGSQIVLITDGFVEVSIKRFEVHNFAGLSFFTDPLGQNPVQPSAGTATITVKTSVQPQGFQPIPNNVIDVTQLGQVDWAANTIAVRADFSGIIGATHARLLVSGNSS